MSLGTGMVGDLNTVGYLTCDDDYDYIPISCGHINNLVVVVRLVVGSQRQHLSNRQVVKIFSHVFWTIVILLSSL